ncbi:AraC-like DNA-binding protein [Saccharothrix tamanrassetensis]|uniref:AraC-like DNA-binding protein n=1 Tax=Saccharothrix tamanrassetensis TaxID=1051531 RepID=A0A841CC80_9PSEU|nr:helix-turn-helix domain-containing protein [Saccharothrix tamanrassetensis]MBB5953615.1 AraC-like DNA-binding protein [Saccharothrix tamanrassetensis]
MTDFATNAASTPQDRLEQFQTVASSAFAPLGIVPHDIRRLRARIRAELTGGLLVSDIRSSACTVNRHFRHISSTDNDVYKIVLQVSGRMVVSQDGRRSEMLPGDIAIYDTTRPYTLEHRAETLGREDEFRTIAIACPRPYLAPNAATLRQVIALPVPTRRGVRRLVAGFFTGLADELGTDVALGGIHLADSLVDMIAMTFTGRDVVVENGRSGLADRITAYCEANLADPNLSPRMIARTHRISVRYLYRLFAEQDRPLSAWIRSRRLERIRQDLENPRLAGRTVAAIAARWGLYDAPHVSRTFRAAYGISPSDYRRHALRTSEIATRRAVD